MTGERVVSAADWAAITAAAGLPADAAASALVAALRARRPAVAPSVRTAAIRACRRCDPQGWRLEPNGQPADVARRCDHRPPLDGRDVTAPIHETPSPRGTPNQ